ncbi:unnamed protein product [Ostreobium quekettii]|uniref:NECAP PHear domain-containing protein n=1 Tax=Ostreobium quekettii TaxID=121088 RepID=A0A8S1JDZ3_9CHLO|nr:unnamed protein product [Ostreobium quekettii]
MFVPLAAGEEYAQCPVPNDKQVSTAIEPVVDSSRYFVLKVVDRASGRHAFVGLGFSGVVGVCYPIL